VYLQPPLTGNIT